MDKTTPALSRRAAQIWTRIPFEKRDQVRSDIEENGEWDKLSPSTKAIIEKAEAENERRKTD